MPTLFLTGSSGALGGVICDLFLREGWSVAGFSRSNRNIRNEHFHFYHVDAANDASVAEAFRTAVREVGTPRALIATIGGVRPWKTVADTTVEDLHALLDLNLTSFFLAAKYAMPLMKGEGTIISIGAEPALSPEAKKSGYVAAKAGVIAMTRVIAEEGKSVGITANCIVPTVIHTKANEEWGTPEEIPKWTKPEDIAAMCLFLSSEAGNAVNGAVIRMPNRV